MLENLVLRFTVFFEETMALIGFVIQMFKDIVYVVKLTHEFVGKIPLLFSWLPSPIISVIVIIFVVVVIYKVLGREG